MTIRPTVTPRPIRLPSKADRIAREQFERDLQRATTQNDRQQAQFLLQFRSGVRL